MAATPVNPTPGLTTQVTIGLTAVRVANGGVNGGVIQNPSSYVDQGLVSGPAQTLYVDPVGNCAPVGGAMQANGTIYAIPPGGTWNLIPGQTTPTMVNANAAIKFSVAIW